MACASFEEGRESSVSEELISAVIPPEENRQTLETCSFDELQASITKAKVTREETGDLVQQQANVLDPLPPKEPLLESAQVSKRQSSALSEREPISSASPTGRKVTPSEVFPPKALDLSPPAFLSSSSGAEQNVFQELKTQRLTQEEISQSIASAALEFQNRPPVNVQPREVRTQAKRQTQDTSLPLERLLIQLKNSAYFKLILLVGVVLWVTIMLYLFWPSG